MALQPEELPGGTPRPRWEPERRPTPRGAKAKAKTTQSRDGGAAETRGGSESGASHEQQQNSD
eukprot:7258525-Pyramimonas_sp.AAC.1